MNKASKALVAAAALAAAPAAHATPSTTFWTPATTYVQPYLVPHLTYDTYVASKGMLQNDYGVTTGVLPFEAVQGEVGVDMFLPALSVTTPSGAVRTGAGDNLQLNGKLTLTEGALAAWSPAVSVGVANVGFKSDYSDYDLLHLTVGKTTPVGLLGVGGYYGAGSKVLWSSSDGKVNRAGFMASWVSPDITIDKPGLNKIVFLADVATGNNWLGAVGGGIGLYFTPAIDVLFGPVYYQDQNLYKNAFGTGLLWTVQLDVDVDFHAPKKP